ncbi:MAG: DoxX family membrane protein [Candidatus Azambacteria bacterium]|nr:DoxX family membrane protein [Candidatus Azambacteria bacterium]
MEHHIIEESRISAFLFSNTKMAWFWTIIRVYVGWIWLEAGWVKAHKDVWVGSDAGVALTGFLKGALGKTGGEHPDVQWWYAWFLENVVMKHTVGWSYLVTYGEILVGVAMIIGALTGIAAFFGLFMNLNYLLAGTVSINPISFTLSIGIILAWRISGYFGVDRYLLPALGQWWSPKRISHTQEAPPHQSQV